MFHVQALIALFFLCLQQAPLFSMDADLAELSDILIDDTENATDAIVNFDDAYNKGAKVHKKNYSLDAAYLGITTCRPTEKSEQLFALSQLTKIILSHNKITDFSTEFLSGAKNLMFLDLSGNQISSIPTELPKHTLQKLRLNNNNITSIDLESVCNALPSLKGLALHHNKITNYGILQNQQLPLEELWIDLTASDSVKKMILKHMPNLTAEIYEHDHSVQKKHAIQKLNIKKYIQLHLKTTALFMALGTVVLPVMFELLCTTVKAPLPLQFEVQQEKLNDFVKFIVRYTPLMCFGVFMGCIISPMASISLCLRRRDEFIEEVIIKPIAQYPSIKDGL